MRTVSLIHVRGKGAIAWRGTFSWSEPVTGEEVGRIAYMVNLETLTLYLKYGSTSDGETKDIASYFGLCTSRLFSGGLRYWISCTYCERRVGTIHLPPGATRFRCRKCYDLTYVSCQRNHQFDRVFARIGKDTGLPADKVKRLLEQLK